MSTLLEFGGHGRNDDVRVVFRSHSVADCLAFRQYDIAATATGANPMTPTTSEREARDLRHELIRVYRSIGNDEMADKHEAALTREQREGVVTFAVDDVRFDVPASIAEKVAAKLAPADNLPQPETPGAVAAGVVVEGGGVTWWDEVPARGTSVFTTPPAPVGVRVDAPKPDWLYWYQRTVWWTAKAKEFGYDPDNGIFHPGNATIRADVRLQQLADKWERLVAHNTTDEGEAFRHCASDLRALLDGQPAGVDSTGDSPEDHACFIEACADTFAQTGRPTTARTLREAATELRRLAALGGGGGRG